MVFGIVTWPLTVIADSMSDSHYIQPNVAPMEFLRRQLPQTPIRAKGSVVSGGARSP
jgi:hypothetical protein